MLSTLTRIDDQLDVWLETVTAPQPRDEWWWDPRWSGRRTGIRGPEHLAVLISSLRPDGDFAGIADAHSTRWAQVKRLESDWWVEVQDVGSEWPDVFLPSGMAPEGATEYPTGTRPAVWTHQVAAELAWAWLHGRALQGVVRVPAFGR